MSAQPVDIQIFGRSMRVNCPPEQREALLASAAELEQRLQDLKERSRCPTQNSSFYRRVKHLSRTGTRKIENARLCL